MVVGVTKSQANDHVQGLVKSLGATYPMIADGERNFAAFGVDTVPAAFLIDRDGTIVAAGLWSIETTLADKFRTSRGAT